MKRILSPKMQLVTSGSFDDQPQSTANVLWSTVQDVVAHWAGWDAIVRAFSELPSLDLFLAGGMLRSFLLDQAAPSKDFDFLFDGEDSAKFIEILGRDGTLKTGPFGSPRWFPNGHEKRYADLIAIRQFNNGLTPCKNIDDCLRQFDFTANAIAINLKTGTFYDPIGGMSDIRARVLRAVRLDYPDEPISPHYQITRPCVLWFRLLHYAAVNEMKIEASTMDWLVDHKHYRRDLSQFSQLFFVPDKRSLLIY